MPSWCTMLIKRAEDVWSLLNVILLKTCQPVLSYYKTNTMKVIFSLVLLSSLVGFDYSLSLHCLLVACFRARTSHPAVCTVIWCMSLHVPCMSNLSWLTIQGGSPRSIFLVQALKFLAQFRLLVCIHCWLLLYFLIYLV